MDYARAAGAGTKSYEAYYNEKLLVCNARVSYDKITEALNTNGYWKHVLVFQRVDLNRRYAVLFDSNDISERLLVNGLEVDGVHVEFWRHQRRQNQSSPVFRVFLSQLPSGVTDKEIIAVFQEYGKVKFIRPITKVLFQRRYDTGEKLIYFGGPHKDIPSYLNIRGWRTFVSYINQPNTCRLCDKTGHFAKECPINPKNRPDEEHHDTQPDAEDMETNSSEPSTESHNDVPGVLDGLIPEVHSDLDEVNGGLNGQKEEPHVFANVALRTAEEPNELGNVTIEDCLETSKVGNVTEEESKITIQVKSWAERSASEDRGSTHIKAKSGFKPFCPRCKVDSHSEEECWNAVCKPSNKRKLSIGVSKPGKGVTKSKKSRTISRFKQDLQKVVLLGKITDEFRYVMEYANRNEVYACFLLSSFGDFAEYHSVAGVAMADNPEVMELWARYSGEGKSKDAADRQLKWFNEQI